VTKKKLEKMKTSEIIRYLVNNPEEIECCGVFCERMWKEHAHCGIHCPMDSGFDEPAICTGIMWFLLKYKAFKGYPEYKEAQKLDRRWGVKEFLFSLAYSYELAGD
jgi:hypothetical protein